jgi:DNA-directed RNA polymerase subunit RPC12/RpoP
VVPGQPTPPGPQAPQEAALSSVVEYKCPNCGGVVTFDAPSGMMRCASCASQFDPAAFTTGADVAAQPAAASVDPNGEDWSEQERADLRQYTCPSCGGQIMTDATTAATHCPYCDSPTILPSQLTGHRKPNAVLPFKVTKDEVAQALTAHLKSKRLAPKLFRSQARIDQVQGLYVPFWLFDTQLGADVSYRATNVKTWSDSRNQYTRTDTYDVRRAGTVVYDHVPVDAATKIDNSYTEAIEPFDYSAAGESQPTYLLGYLAQTFDADANECRPRAHQRMAASLRSSFSRSLPSYSTVRTVSERITVAAERVHYALMPVWLLNTSYNGKIYTFAMNGQTGEFVGELPTSWSRFWAWFGGLFVGVGAVVALIAYLLMLTGGVA